LYNAEPLIKHRNSAACGTNYGPNFILIFNFISSLMSLNQTVISTTKALLNEECLTA